MKQVSDITRSTIKLRADFVSRKELIDYLCDLCELKLPRTLIQSRIARGWHPYEAITKSRISRPAVNHPFKRHYKEQTSD